jgi:hypothetical protein
VLPAYTKSWLDRTNERSFTIASFSPERFLVSVVPASEKFDSDLEMDARMHKTDAHPCPLLNNNIAPMPTQNPWVWAPNVGLCFTLCSAKGSNYYILLAISAHLRTLRAGSHYGHPNREAERLSGQTLLRVQRNELKIANKI